MGLPTFPVTSALWVLAALVLLGSGVVLVSKDGATQKFLDLWREGVGGGEAPTKQQLSGGYGGLPRPPVYESTAETREDTARQKAALLVG